jgi:hypothetical protein
VTGDLRGSLTLEPSGASGARAVVDLPLPPALSPDPG